MGVRAAQYIYLREAWGVTIAEDDLGSGKTLTAKICESQAGDPVDIGGLTETATAVDGQYNVFFLRADLLTDLAAYLGKRVYLHLDDGVAWHDVWPLVPTDVDPSLLPPLLD